MVVFFQVDGDVMGIDKSTVSRVVHNFCKALVAKKGMFVQFPFRDNVKTENKIKFFIMHFGHRWFSRPNLHSI